ncbi:unnamed protein product [Ectocarpus sp. CCAP 1310/34]|nr:unnamed protein product [Ectocarpus sp. CCAP 1310/34]
MVVGPVVSSRHCRGGFGMSRFPTEVSFGLTLWRLACPTTLLRDRLFWGIGEAMMCEIFNLKIEAIYERWGHLVDQLQHEAILPNVDIFCAAIHAKGAPLDRRWAFIDGTIKAIARRSRKQRLWYNGWKRKHALKYQAVDTPDGIIRQLWGPMLGRRHDVSLLGESGLLQYMQQWFNDAGNPYYIDGDPAFPLSPWLIIGYKGLLTQEQRDFNSDMSSCRVTVEWGFAKVVALWPFVDYAKKQQVALFACGLGKRYSVAGLLTNCRSCLYGNSTSKFIGVRPPTLERYLSGEG